MLGPGLCWSSLARQPGEGVARARRGLVGKGWIEFQGRKGRIRGLGVGPGRAGADRTGTEKAHPHHGQQRGCDVQGARVPAEEQALWGRRAGPCLVQLRGTQRPRPQVEVGEVAAEGVSRREATAQRVLILAQHQDAAGRHRVAGAQSPRPSAPPPVGEQRPAPTPLLPSGAHMVPAAVGAEGCEEGRVVPMHYQRSAHYAPWLGEGAQLQRVGQRGRGNGEERGGVGRGTVPLHVSTRSQRRQLRQGAQQPRRAVSRLLAKHQHGSGARTCGDTWAATSVSSPVSMVLLLPFGLAAESFQALGCLPTSGRRKCGLAFLCPRVKPRRPVQGKGTWRCNGVLLPAHSASIVTVGSYLLRSPEPLPLVPIFQGPTLTPLRGSLQRDLSLAHPDQIAQP